MDSREACPSVLPLVLWGLHMRRERPILVSLFAASSTRDMFHKKTVDEEASVQFGTSQSCLENAHTYLDFGPRAGCAVSLRQKNL